jgi:hypothetical protein
MRDSEIVEGSDEPPRSADIPVCGFTGHSCPVFLAFAAVATGHRRAGAALWRAAKAEKSPGPAGWKACATSRFRDTRRDVLSGKSLARPASPGEEETARAQHRCAAGEDFRAWQHNCVTFDPPLIKALAAQVELALEKKALRSPGFCVYRLCRRTSRTACQASARRRRRSTATCFAA